MKLKTDWILFVTALCMMTVGILMVYSASSIMAEVDVRYHSTWHFVIRQAAFGAVAIGVMMGLKSMPYTRLRSPSVAMSVISISLLLLFAVLFLDPTNQRFLRVGPVGVQPSELAKPALVIFLAYFITWRARAINNPRYTLIPAAMAVGVVILLVVVADLGTAIVLAAAAALVFFVAGLELRYCAIVGVLAAVGLIYFVCAKPYRLGRVIRFFDPKLTMLDKIDHSGRLRSRIEESLTTRDTNYQLEQSQVALGAGGISGMGLMKGRQKLLYLPEAHKDFIFAVAGEELGMIGTVGLLAGFVIIFWRGLRTAVRMKHDDFGRYLALGLTVVVVVQGFIHMSVVLGIMPTKGIPLPMISYGGSSLFSTLAMLGILMNVSEHAG